MSAQPETLVDLPNRAVDAQTADLLAAMATRKDISWDTEQIVRAVVLAAKKPPRGFVTANNLHEFLVGPDGLLVVKPQQIGSVFRQLALLGVLTRRGHVLSENYRTGNATHGISRWRYWPDRIPLPEDSLISLGPASIPLSAGPSDPTPGGGP